MLGVVVWDLKGRKAIHMETEKQMFDKQMFEMLFKDNGIWGTLIKWALLGSSLCTTTSSYYTVVIYGKCSFLEQVFYLKFLGGSQSLFLSLLFLKLIKPKRHLLGWQILLPCK